MHQEGQGDVGRQLSYRSANARVLDSTGDSFQMRSGAIVRERVYVMKLVCEMLALSLPFAEGGKGDIPRDGHRPGAETAPSGELSTKDCRDNQLQRALQQVLELEVGGAQHANQRGSADRKYMIVD